MLVDIIKNTPLWVWGLFAALVVLGLYQRQARQVRPAQLLTLPLVLLGLGLSSTGPAFVHQPLLGLLWLGALTSAVWLGLRLPIRAGTQWDATSQRLHVPGSWFPMGLILIIFSLRYAVAVSMALHPAWKQSLAVQAPLTLAFGLLSGIFLGRSLGLFRLTRGLTIRPHGQPV